MCTHLVDNSLFVSTLPFTWIVVWIISHGYAHMFACVCVHLEKMGKNETWWIAVSYASKRRCSNRSDVLSFSNRCSNIHTFSWMLLQLTVRCFLIPTDSSCSAVLLISFFSVQLSVWRKYVVWSNSCSVLISKQAITALKKGAQLLKYGRRGKPKFCPFRLSNVCPTVFEEQYTFLYWFLQFLFFILF